MRALLLFLFIGQMVGCAELMQGTSYWDVMNQPEPFFVPQKDFPLTAGDSGKVAFGDSEVKARTPETPKQQERYAYEQSLQRELFNNEQQLDEGERRFYNKYRQHLPTVSDRIYFLGLDPNSRREYLKDLGVIEHQVAHSRGRSIASVAFGDMSLEKPLTVGMTKNEVSVTWGQPAIVEFAGNPSFQNERWSFSRNGRTNYIYFESGRVSGWDLE